MCLTFDVDMDYLWSRDAQVYLSTWPGRALMALGLSRLLGNSLATEAQGEYERRVAIARILDLLDRHGVKATFFVPGAHAEKYPEIVREIVRRGHEVGHHGYRHESPLHVRGRRRRERALMRRGTEALRQVTGSAPRGYRAPGFDMTQQTVEILAEMGFAYDSSLMADERPYTLAVNGGAHRLLEIPVDWVLDDFAHFAFWKPPVYMRGMAAGSHVLEIWRSEFEGYYETGGCFTVTMHPSIIGRHHRIQVLERLIQEIRQRDDVWFARCIDVAEHLAGSGRAEPAGAEGR